MESEVETYIQQQYIWSKLPKSVKQLLGSSQKEYEKMVVEYSVKNQLRFKGNLIRVVRKDEEKYYELLLAHSRTHLMLYPYHLSDIIVRELRKTPFQYYIDMMLDLIGQERSYDSLPNFTAADCLRLLGVGRNQYIDLVNKCRATKKTFRRRPLRELLPQKPLEMQPEPWWIVQVGHVMEDDISHCPKHEKDVVDMLIDESGLLCGTLDLAVVQSLLVKGLVYLDVPVQGSDHIIVPPLDKFVMNRVLGDYFETLLYKIFVSIDEHTCVTELASILQVDEQLVKNAVSLFCRLSFAHKRITGLENMALHVSWSKFMRFDEELLPDDMFDLSSSLVSPSSDAAAPFGAADDDSSECQSSERGAVSAQSSALDLPDGGADVAARKRIGFLFDSTLTAFLMMGNLSSSLKSHAVTLFEVGKLSDEALNNFLGELYKVRSFGEGEAQRYFEHAQTLRDTIEYLRDYAELDLLRCESLMALQGASRARILQKNYDLLVTMAPLSNDVVPMPYSLPANMGPPVAEFNSPWFRLFLYETLGSGPVSILLSKGTRLRRLPRQLRHCRRLLLCTWSHEPGLLGADHCLVAVNEALQHSAVFLQAYSNVPTGEDVAHIAFPRTVDQSLEQQDNSDAAVGLLVNHPLLVALESRLALNCTCGYATLVRRPVADERVVDASTQPSASAHDPRKAPSGGTASPADAPQPFDEWLLFDMVFGMPLFDARLNRAVCDNLRRAESLHVDKRSLLRDTNRRLTILLLDFIRKFQPIFDDDAQSDNHRAPLPLRSLIYCDGCVSPFAV